MKLNKCFPEFEEVIKEMEVVYKHDNRPWIIGYSGGKDSSLLVSLVIETINRIPEEQRTKDIFIVSSDTGVENPIVQKYMHSSSQKINEFSKNNKYNIKAEIIYPEVKKTYWTLVIGLGYPTPEPPGFRWCTDRLKINPMIGALAMSLSSVSVVLNALTINLFKPNKLIDEQNSNPILINEINKENNKMKTFTFKVEGMMCMRCVAHVEKACLAVSGVESAKADLDTGVVTVVCESEEVLSVAKKAVTDADYIVID